MDKLNQSSEFHKYKSEEISLINRWIDDETLSQKEDTDLSKLLDVNKSKTSSNLNDNLQTFKDDIKIISGLINKNFSANIPLESSKLFHHQLNKRIDNLHTSNNEMLIILQDKLDFLLNLLKKPSTIGLSYILILLLGLYIMLKPNFRYSNKMVNREKTIIIHASSPQKEIVVKTLYNNNNDENTAAVLMLEGLNNLPNDFIISPRYKNIKTNNNFKNKNKNIKLIKNDSNLF